MIILKNNFVNYNITYIINGSIKVVNFEEIYEIETIIILNNNHLNYNITCIQNEPLETTYFG
jgi:hypothetical protein